jgi:hypothetical protein
VQRAAIDALFGRVWYFVFFIKPVYVEEDWGERIEAFRISYCGDV